MGRSLKLDMDYTMMHSLVEDLSTKELESEIELLNKSKTVARIEDATEEHRVKMRKVSTLEKIVSERWKIDLEKNLVVTEEHRELLRNMYFKTYREGGDYVFIGVDGKRPFGDSSLYRCIAEILKWELPNDYLSNEQQERAERLIDELPFALNQILK